jgi:hypothetical protein
VRLNIVEEYWPDQKPGIRTGRIELWPPPSGERALEVGRITVGSELFDELREHIERRDYGTQGDGCMQTDG